MPFVEAQVMDFLNGYFRFFVTDLVTYSPMDFWIKGAVTVFVC
jgi:hypothetical protein